MFYLFKVQGNLQLQNYGKKLAAVSHDKNFHADRAMGPLNK